MVRVSIYVEGGGDSKEQHVRCRKGRRSFQVLAELDPNTLKSSNLSYFKRFAGTLDYHLPEGDNIRSRCIDRPIP